MSEWGLCHLCPKKGPRPIEFCSVCGHYFCSECRNRYWDRGLEAVKELVAKAFGSSPEGYCCGPEEETSDQRSSSGTRP